MIQGSVGYCRCGQEIWLEYLRKDQTWFCRFSTPEGAEVTACPACGRVLDEDNLDSLTSPVKK